MVYLGLCSMCAPKGVAFENLCPSCGSCIHICRGANEIPCQHVCSRCGQTPVTTVPDLGPDPLCPDCVTTLCIERVQARMNAIWDIVVEHCGGHEDMRDDFRRAYALGTREFRFGGNFGFGGKVRPFYKPHPIVSYYLEDETDERKAAAMAANKALTSIGEA